MGIIEQALLLDSDHPWSHIRKKYAIRHDYTNLYLDHFDNTKTDKLERLLVHGQDWSLHIRSLFQPPSSMVITHPTHITKLTRSHTLLNQPSAKTMHKSKEAPIHRLTIPKYFSRLAGIPVHEPLPEFHNRLETAVHFHVCSDPMLSWTPLHRHCIPGRR